MKEHSFCPQGSGFFGQAINFARLLRIAALKYKQHAQGCAICQWPADGNSTDVADLLRRAEESASQEG